MDAAAKKNALFRAKVKAQAQKKRIDSSLVWYNEDGQPVCRVCNVRLKSDALWPAHQASSKHHEAIENLKAKASRQKSVNNAKPDASTELHDAKQPPQIALQTSQKESTELQKSHPSSVLPADFFDNQESKRQRTGSAAPKSMDSGSSVKVGLSAQTAAMDEVDVWDSTGKVSSLGAAEMRQNTVPSLKTLARIETAPDSATGQVKGALPEGFFDNKDADLRARGIEPVKPDVKDEYKEFEKLIQEDLKEVDNRLEEEEIDAAEKIEEEETVEQRTYRDRVEFLRRKRMELIAARSSKPCQDSEVATKKPDPDESSSEDDDDDKSFAVDWRAQHL
ncbi:hypothetical protein Ancab_017691 [Ancistrocladus abbreviatus]